MNILKIIGYGVVAVLVIDALGLMLWVVSGQHPVDEFYLGTITAHVVAWVVGIN